MQCPYPHAEPVELAGEAPVLLCSDGKKACYQPVIVCPGCGAANRSLARFCRSCRAELSFASRESELLDGTRVGQQQTGARRRLADVGAKGFSLLHSHCGFFVVGTREGRLCVTDAIDLKTCLAEFKLGSAPLHAAPAEDGRQAVLAITTSQSLHRLTMVPGFACEVVADLSEFGQTNGPGFIAGSSWVVLASDGVNTQVVACVNGRRKVRKIKDRTSPPVMAAGRLYFISSSTMYCYDLAKDDLSKADLPADEWDLRVVPVLDPEASQIYLTSQSRIYQASLKKDLGPMRLPGTDFANHRMCVHNKKLVVAHSGGLTVLNSYRGTRLWDMRDDLRSERTSAGFTPQVSAGYVLFVSLNSGQQAISLVPLTEILADRRGVAVDIVDVADVDQISPEPVFGTGCLVVGSAKESALLVHRLVQ